MASMTLSSTRIAAGGTVAALGVLAAVALGAGSKDPAKTVTKPAAAPPIVRTVVIRRTVRVVKHEKPKPAPKAAPPAPAPAPAIAPAPVQVAQVQPVKQSRPLRTKTSGAASGGRERGDGESENADD